MYSKEQWSDLLLLIEDSDNNLLTQEAGLVAQDTQYINDLKFGSVISWEIYHGLTKTVTSVQSTTTLTPESIARKQPSAPLLCYGGSWSQTEVEKTINGDVLTPAAQKDLMNTVAAYYESALISSVKGAFAASSASSFKKDLTSETLDADKLITFSNLVEIKGEFFPSKNIGTPILVCNQKVFDNIVTTMASSSTGFQTDAANLALSAGTIKKLAGLTLVVNDNLAIKTLIPEDETYQAHYEYTSYLVRPGGFWMNTLREPQIELDKNILAGAITTYMACYVWFMCGVAFADWQARLADTPTKAQLETGSNWAFDLFDNSEARVIQIKSYVDLPVAVEASGE